MKLDRKNKTLLLGAVIVLYICYKYAISNTLFYYSEYGALKEKLTQNNISPSHLTQLKKKEFELDRLLSKYSVGNGNFQNSLLTHINKNCRKYNLRVVGFEEPYIFTNYNITSSTYQFTVEGSFNGSLLLLNSIENASTFGVIQHVDFNKKRNYKNNSETVFTTFLLQVNDQDQR